jgi:hypothetical protein
VTLRVVLVTRRFWPLEGETETLLADLAEAWRALGARTVVLTARWRADWPAETEYRGVRVVRLAHPAPPAWGAFWYRFALGRWLRRHRNEFDVACVSSLKDDAFAALGAASRAGFPVVLRAERSGWDGDVCGQLEAPWGKRMKKRCYRAAALVAPSRAVELELIAGGYPRDRIHCLPNEPDEPVGAETGVSPPARSAKIAEAHLELFERVLRDSKLGKESRQAHP